MILLKTANESPKTYVRMHDALSRTSTYTLAELQVLTESATDPSNMQEASRYLTFVNLFSIKAQLVLRYNGGWLLF